MYSRIAVYVVLGFVTLVALLAWKERADGRLEEREQRAVAHAIRWHKGYTIARDSVRKITQRAEQSARVSRALRDSVRILSDSSVLVLPDSAESGSLARPDTVYVPRIVVRRLVADSVTISHLTQLVAVQGRVLVLADSTIAAYQSALAAAQANRCRLFWKVPCPSRKTTALLTAGGLLVVKLTLGSAK